MSAGLPVLRPVGEDHRWDVTLDPAWSSLRGVHGGYLAAAVVLAAERAHPDRAVRTLHVSFLRAAVVGEAEVTLQTVRRGGSSVVSTVQIRQEDQPVLVASVTSLASRPDGPAWDTPLRDGPAPFEDCTRLLVPSSVGHFVHARAVVDPTDLPFRQGDRARLAGYVTPTVPRAVDAAWVAMLLDWFPPSPFSRHDRPVGGVSVDYTVHIHRIPSDVPADGWLTMVTESTDGGDGLALEHGRLADPAGRVVAESFHTRLLAGDGPADIVATLG